MKKKAPRPSLAARGEAWLEAAPYRAPAVLAAFTCSLWAPTLFLALHYWDDSVYLFEDPRLTWTFSHLWQILTRPFFANFHPVTTFTYLVDRSLWGGWIPGYNSAMRWFPDQRFALAVQINRSYDNDLAAIADRLVGAYLTAPSAAPES